MDRRNVTGLNGRIHEALFNSHTDALIDVACDATRYTVVKPYTLFDPAQLTDAPATCTDCRTILDAAPGAPLHPADTARECANTLLADADNRGYPPTLDDEGLRLAFARLAPDAGHLRPLFERLARGVYDPQNSYRTQPLYALIQEHLTDTLTERALQVPANTPKVLVRYVRYTGGELQAPVGVGDRLTYDGLASGHWPTGTVTAVENSGVLVDFHNGYPPRHYHRHEVPRCFAFKLDRAPQPTTPPAATPRP
ncbi:hypothetical protein OG730_41540 (plasmid) [Streptomyces sp. NBC_01298]|uniref:hypothetical protein n=1 Tax=Streptomyces sp. NBC_01298 TaxID=2903817 RepID=UPI002E0DA04B|nr:hypothetical protein OG730_42485 [Streptomyces sp. NBC_01298]WSK25953.1 hypothetical protein OG730_41540 [Streptomyces sp. NBC_01298]